MDKEKIGKLIRTRRKEKGLSQRQFAESLQVSDSTVSKWENGVNLPDTFTLKRIAEELDIPLAELLDFGDCADGAESGFDNGEACDEMEPCNKMEPVRVPSAPTVEEAPGLRMEPLPDDASPKPKARWLKWSVFGICLMSIAIVCLCYLAFGRKDETFSAEICDEYQGDYEGQDAYYIIVEFNREPSIEELYDYGENIRRKYEIQFFSSDLIIIIYIKDYAHYREKGFDEMADYLDILYPN